MGYKMTNQNNDYRRKKFAKITFYGAALEVTGSCHLVEANGQRVLLDCGLHQGSSAAKKMNSSAFDFDPSKIDMVVLSHAHLDHSGSLPKLVAAGFNGPIHCTTGTAKLLRILLEDSFKLYFHDIERNNIRRKRSGRELLEMSYHAEDVEKVLSLCHAHHYKDSNEIAQGIVLRYQDAGHILGSAIVELTVSKDQQSKTIVFSGDLGNPDTSLMQNPTPVEHADLVLMESTYGDRNHRGQADTLAEFKYIIDEVGRDGGNILIPSFAVGRTQELLFQLGYLYQQGFLEGWKVFLDSPMASKVTSVYDQSMAQLDHKDTELMRSYGSIRLEQFLPCLTISETVEESMLINERQSKAIIIAGSGMCTGGRIRHHFKQRIWSKDTHIIFVGFQAQGTVGRRLVDGTKRLKLFGQDMVVKAKIHTIGGFSAHAGQDELIQWAKAFGGEPKFYLVHGEQRAIVELRDQLLMRVNINADIAVKGASVYL
ncbi:MAG: metallo-beta-lactamase family protein [Arenicella sp.]|jgi:metallo-beta-lactamase family protein